MKILFLGDIVARCGRDAVIENLSILKEKYQTDFTIANAENAAHGKGITTKIYNRLIAAGVDMITLGNHAFAKSEILNQMSAMHRIIRPANMDPQHVGQYYAVKEVNGKRVAVMNLVGKVFMDVCREDPIITAERLLKDMHADIVLVDFHAEATAEKITFANFYASRLTAVLGTHTHVQTADERIIGGCAFITDVGMCGAYESILGRDINEVISRSIYNESTRYRPAEGAAMICAVVIEINDRTNRAVGIERIQIRPKG